MNRHGEAIGLYKVDGVNAELGIQLLDSGGLYFHFPSMGTSPARQGKPGKRRNPERYALKGWLKGFILDFQPRKVVFVGGPGGDAVVRMTTFSAYHPLATIDPSKLRNLETWLDSAVAAVGNYRYDVFLKGFRQDWRGSYGLPGWNVSPTGKVSRSKPADYPKSFSPPTTRVQK